MTKFHVIFTVREVVIQRMKGQGEGFYFYEGSSLSHGFIFSEDCKEWVTEGTSDPIGA